MVYLNIFHKTLLYFNRGDNLAMVTASYAYDFNPYHISRLNMCHFHVPLYSYVRSVYLV